MITGLKLKSVIVVIEGFSCLIIAHLVLSSVLSPTLNNLFPDIPQISNEIILSSAISPIIAILYIMVRTKQFPILIIDRNLLISVVIGILLSWIVYFLNMIVSEKEIPFAINILNSPKPFLYLNILLVILWGPLLEETLFRGYFLKYYALPAAIYLLFFVQAFYLFFRMESGVPSILTLSLFY